MRSSGRTFIHLVPGLLAVLVAGALVPQGGAAAQTGGSRAPGALAPAEGVLFGAHVQVPRKGDPAVSIAELEGKLGRRLAIEHYYRPWGEAFPDGREATNVAAGRIPMISWGKTSTGDVNAGAHDPMVRAHARGIRAFGQPVLLRWFWEMGGNRNATTAVSPADYVAAWRRLHGLFAEEGATNAAWVWCPDASDFADGRAQSFYPGDDVVDWTCADGYNFRHPSRRGTEARSFEDTFAAFYAWASEQAKPIMIGEYGTLEDGPGDKAAWVDASRRVLQERFPEIAAVVYFHSQRERDGLPYDWRMDTSPESMAAFAAMGADPWFNPSVVITLPDTVVDAGPDGLVATRSAEFGFSVPAGGPAPGGFACRLDGGPFGACSTPARFDALADGAHTFEVRALAADGRPDPTPARRQWMVDATAPAVTAVDPGDGAEDVTLRTAVSAVFSEDVDPASVNFTLVDERTGMIVEGEVAYAANDRRVTFTPARELLPASSYRATVDAGVRDAAGNAKAEPEVWRFTTAGLVPGLP